ncbi:3-dehydroquinate synthase [Maribacter cobaltidurans]|uniref:3-dehydroquinate synthase n=1 Tax=Maribacter cobaltidurans TaxID=1178778 RepID=A0A223VB79_9FLAO|nr:3-dehydroquinate synthase [Maribacter cobaltidurans]ASV32119.1 3-dehydroquinate synthase [Maribacter cobaltidurans]GGD91621.1 3-dehydroquinate synthase [Maribacter cobaltidurans]
MQSIVSDSYAVHFENRAFEALNSHLNSQNYSTIFILVDENTHELCLPQFMSEIEGEYTFEIIEIESGEVNKTIETCVGVWEALSELGADRKSLMINLGGGVLTDLGGFVASTFKRGINFINVPTTLLSMVDASVGGKTGVDLGPLKNQIGVINQPEMVLIVSDFLETLNERQITSGFAEMLKHGLIKNAGYWESLKKVSSLNEIKHHIRPSVALKNEVVLQDPTEQNIRKILNYGHTLGHAIESYFLENESKETLLHGEAIAIGMITEGYLSYKLTGLAKDALVNIKSTFLKYYPKVDFTDKDILDILELLKYDKKNSHGNINFVLLKQIGETQIDVTISSDLFHEAFAYYME